MSNMGKDHGFWALAVALLLLSLSIGSALGALQISVPLTKMCNLSVDPGPDFVIQKNLSDANSTSKLESNVVIVNSKEPKAGSATLIASAKSGSLDGLSMDDLVLSMFTLAGAEEVMNKTVKSSDGQDVMIHTLRTTESMDTHGQMMSLAFWDLDEMNSISVISTLDLNTTEKIVETLTEET